MEPAIYQVKYRSNASNEEPFHFAYDMCRAENTPCFRSLAQCLEGEMEGITAEQLKQQIINKPQNASKFVTYRSMLNIGLDIHDIYKTSIYIPDYLRISLSRHIRETYSNLDFTSIDYLLNEKVHLLDLCTFIHDVLALFSCSAFHMFWYKY